MSVIRHYVTDRQLEHLAPGEISTLPAQAQWRHTRK
jgi:hypothetical protein